MGRHKMRNLITIFFLAVSMAIASCGSYNDISGENYGDITASPSSIILTEAEHATGWGKADCLLCHNTENIHQVNRTSLDLDMAAIREIVEQRGQASCTGCHGANGVE